MTSARSTSVFATVLVVLVLGLLLGGCAEHRSEVGAAGTLRGETVVHEHSLDVPDEADGVELRLNLDHGLGRPHRRTPRPLAAGRCAGARSRPSRSERGAGDAYRGCRRSPSGRRLRASDVWVSMGEPKDVGDQRVRLLTPFQVNAAAMERTANLRVKFMHPLPAFHDKNTVVGREVIEHTGLEGGLEVTDEVFESSASLVFDQAENHLHTIKAVLIATLAVSNPTHRRGATCSGTRID